MGFFPLTAIGTSEYCFSRGNYLACWNSSNLIVASIIWLCKIFNETYTFRNVHVFSFPKLLFFYSTVHWHFVHVFIALYWHRPRSAKTITGQQHTLHLRGRPFDPLDQHEVAQPQRSLYVFPHRFRANQTVQATRRTVSHWPRTSQPTTIVAHLTPITGPRTHHHPAGIARSHLWSSGFAQGPVKFHLRISGRDYAQRS